MCIRDRERCSKTLIFAHSINSVSAIYRWLTSRLHQNAFRDGRTDDLNSCSVTMFHAHIAEPLKQYTLSKISKPDSTIRVLVCTVAWGLQLGTWDRWFTGQKVPSLMTFWQKVGVDLSVWSWHLQWWRLCTIFCNGTTFAESLTTNSKYPRRAKRIVCYSWEEWGSLSAVGSGSTRHDCTCPAACCRKCFHMPRQPDKTCYCCCIVSVSASRCHNCCLWTDECLNVMMTRVTEFSRTVKQQCVDTTKQTTLRKLLLMQSKDVTAISQRADMSQFQVFVASAFLFTYMSAAFKFIVQSWLREQHKIGWSM